jgi:hypothetical protein
MAGGICVSRSTSQVGTRYSTEAHPPALAIAPRTNHRIRFALHRSPLMRVS